MNDNQRGPNGSEMRLSKAGVSVCVGKRRDGENCRAPACAGDTHCRWHGGRRRIPRTCTCDGYAYPHRPSRSGRCRFYTPDPSGARVFRWPGPGPAGVNKPTGRRRRGPWGRIMRELGLHPIRDAAKVARLRKAYFSGEWQTWQELKDLLAD